MVTNNPEEENVASMGKDAESVEEQLLAVADTDFADEAIAAMMDVSDDMIDTESFNEIQVDSTKAQAARDAWKMFLNQCSSRDAAGELLYTAFYDAVPSLQKNFETPRAVMSGRFVGVMATLAADMDDPKKLKTAVEVLGFAHLNFEATVPRGMIFRDALIDMFAVELGAKWTSDAQYAWTVVMNYICGCIVYCRTNYAERIQALTSSWSKVRDDSGKKEDEEGKEEDKEKEEEHDSTKKKRNVQNVPTTFVPMFQFNAAVMGIDDRAWMQEVLAVFDDLVLNVANPARLQEDCDILAIRINKVKGGMVVTYSEYKSCMLAALRSLLPKEWSNNHEVAWSWLWETVERLLSESEITKRGNQLEKALVRLWDGLEDDEKHELRAALYTEFFTSTPAGEDHFKQSAAYLHLVADKVLAMSLTLYKEPVQMVDDLSAVGLRHVGYGIPTELFDPYIQAWQTALTDFPEVEDIALNAFRISMGLVSRIMVRTIIQGSTLVMKAINNNSGKMMKNALAIAPRGERANWMLLVQVGTQSISPLEWSVKSGALDAASAMLSDLLTIRADRERYYFPKEEVFSRHADILQMFLDEAPDLVPQLFDGLLWRSTVNDNGMRRVNYYLKQLIADEDGERPDTFALLTGFQDPKLVCHPMVIVLTDIVWSRATYPTFLAGKVWLFFTLLVFVCSQAIQELHEYPEVIFGCRVFVYMLSMSQVIYSHVRKFIIAFTSGETMSVFCLTLPNYLRDRQEAFQLMLAMSLFGMFGLEPILQCWADNEGMMFTPNCKRASALLAPYSFLAMVSMILYFVLLTDLSVFNQKISAYLLVAGQVVSELYLFLFAMFAVLLAAACSLSVLEQEVKEFKVISDGMMTMWEMYFGMLTPDVYAKVHEEPVVTLGCYAFVLVTGIYLTNLLAAQLTCSYKVIFNDMVGYARLGRVRIINDTLPRVSKKRWTRVLESLLLDEKLEFNEGDVGVAGGIQLLEPASVHPTLVDSIKRFGGTTSSAIAWPEEESLESGEDAQIEKLEKIIQKGLQARADAMKASKRRAQGGADESGLSSQHSAEDEEE
eukprot:TRINITY_DN13656_c0_g1_i1.p1 TRINITY_DN13656_c0_g1~~TRINITY_DN13656_c0_g1_i1.p1  ORF type:complete len:1060 (-),score=260.92 TRINITY_DN13656_c0_g1_i1:266-3445(-)